MHTPPVDDYALYRHRYGFAYVVLTAVIVILLTLNFTSLPAGLSQAEQASVLASSRLNLVFDSITIFPKALLEFLQQADLVNLPYHLLQKSTLETFGLSPLGVRLPSLLVAGASIGMLFVLLQRLIRAKSAIVASLLIATSSWLISLGRLGTPDSMIVFWTVLLLLLMTVISQQAKHQRLWKLLTLLSLGLALYTPGMAVLIAVAVIASMLQPHVRYMVRRISPGTAVAGTAVVFAMLAPLGFTLWQHPSIAFNLLLIPTELPGIGDFFANLLAALGMLFNPLAISLAGTPQPLVALPTTVLALVGLIRLIKDWHSVRSHVLLIWLALVVPLVGLSGSRDLNFLFIPIMLLAAIGIQSLINYWYTLFPRNPYARFFGLLPLGLLIVVVVQFNYQRYFQTLPYAKEAVAFYDQDPFLLWQTLRSGPNRDKRVLLVVPNDKLELYRVNRAVSRQLNVTTAEAFGGLGTTERVIVAQSEEAKLAEGQKNALKQLKANVVVDAHKDNGLRFTVYSSL